MEKEPEPPKPEPADDKGVRKKRMAYRMPKISLDGGKAAREMARYPDAPLEMLSKRDNDLANSEKEDTMYTWLGLDNQEQLDRMKGIDKFKLLAKRVTLREDLNT